MIERVVDLHVTCLNLTNYSKFIKLKRVIANKNSEMSLYSFNRYNEIISVVFFVIETKKNTCTDALICHNNNCPLIQGRMLNITQHFWFSISQSLLKKR